MAGMFFEPTTLLAFAIGIAVAFFAGKLGRSLYGRFRKPRQMAQPVLSRQMRRAHQRREEKRRRT